MEKLKVVVRGGGDLATGTIHRLWSAGFRVLVLECAQPSAIRHQVALSDAVYEGKVEFEGLSGVLIADSNEAEAIWQQGKVPVLIDEDCSSLGELKPDVVVDAIIAKKNLGTTKAMAPLTIALGPGFEAGVDVDYVVETKRGHNLGRIIKEGFAVPNSGVPGIIAGYGKERVLHAEAEGVLHVIHDIGEVVEKEQVIAEIATPTGNVPVLASLTGLIRGMIRDGFYVTKSFKIADIDPRKEELANCYTISDKARCIAGSVLELVCRFQNERLSKC